MRLSLKNLEAPKCPRSRTITPVSLARVVDEDEDKDWATLKALAGFRDRLGFSRPGVGDSDDTLKVAL